MAKPPLSERGAPVPASRLSRMVRVGGMVTGVLGGAAATGAQSLVRGERPNLRGMVLTPGNAQRVASELARMRGAAMKLGQLLSLDDGAILPPELAEIFATLRKTARPMAPKQLKQVLIQAWGSDFTRRFKRFDPQPIAAASIGQVHRAQTRDGRDLAIKVQYPGVRDSIDSDVSTLGTLLKVPGLLPKGADIGDLLEAARLQLHEEADYHREADHLERFGRLLADTPHFIVPALHRDLSTDNVLAMSYEAGDPIESAICEPQDRRDALIAHLVTLTLRELFEFGWMQTDPNFANYTYHPGTDRIVLLDFGATVAFSPEIASHARVVLDAALARDRDGVGRGLAQMGMVDPEGDPAHYLASMEIVALAMQPMQDDAPFDIAASDLTRRIVDAGFAIEPEQALRHLPPPELLFLQRKIAGLYLLATRLKAQIPVRRLLENTP